MKSRQNAPDEAAWDAPESAHSAGLGPEVTQDDWDDPDPAFLGEEELPPRLREDWIPWDEEDLEEPQPEHGDFWPEIDEHEEFGIKKDLSMLPQGKIIQVRRLLEAGGLSQRKIAAICGVCRATVGAIASGKRPDYGERSRARNRDDDRPQTPPQRCVGCGGMVYMPCKLCQVRSRLDHRQHSTPQRVAQARRLAINRLAEGPSAAMEASTSRGAVEPFSAVA